MFKESVCPFAQKRNVDVYTITDGFGFEDLVSELDYYELQISQGVRGKLAKCFILPDFEDFGDLQNGLEVFVSSFSSFTESGDSAILTFPDGKTYFWFVVSNLYPATYHRYMPKNMLLFTYDVFFPSGEDVLYFTLNEAVKKSLGYDPFPSEFPNNHRLCDLYSPIVQNFRRLILTAVHHEAEPEYFHLLCEELVEVLGEEF